MYIRLTILTRYITVVLLDGNNNIKRTIT